MWKYRNRAAFVIGDFNAKIISKRHNEHDIMENHIYGENEATQEELDEGEEDNRDIET